MTLFSGVNEMTAFTWAVVGSPGNNQLFPSGPGTRITAPTPTADDLWREFFRYFLHYQQTGTPKPNLLRIWIVDYNWGTDARNLWETNPSAFFAIFDPMVAWAAKAGMSLCPVLGQNRQSSPPILGYYNPADPLYAAHIAFAKAVMARYDSNPTIAMWDVWNEPDSWVGVTGDLHPWAARLLADLKPSSPSHPIMVGTGSGSLNDLVGQEITSRHTYSADETNFPPTPDPARPHFEGEFGYWSGQGIGYGYWPWFAASAQARGWNSAAMMWTGNGRPAYADYPYTGALPEYPSAPPPPPVPAPGLTKADVQVMIDAAVAGLAADTATKLANAIALHDHPYSFSVAVSKRTGKP